MRVERGNYEMAFIVRMSHDEWKKLLDEYWSLNEDKYPTVELLVGEFIDHPDD